MRPTRLSLIAALSLLCTAAVLVGADRSGGVPVSLRAALAHQIVVPVALANATPAPSPVAEAPAAAPDSAPVAKHPTAKQKADGAKIVQQIQSTKGKAYVDQQRKLPDTIVVP